MQGRLLHQRLTTPAGAVVDERAYSHDPNSNILAISAEALASVYEFSAFFDEWRQEKGLADAHALALEWSEKGGDKSGVEP